MELKKRAICCKALAILGVSAIFISCGGGHSSTVGSPSSGSSGIAVTVAPPSATLAPGGTQLYTATVTGTTDTSVTWTAGGIQGGNSTFGTISSSGLYTAPAVAPNPSTVKISAISVADSTKSGTADADIRVHHDNQDPQSGAIKLGTSGGNSTDTTRSGTSLFCCSGTLGSLVSRAGTFYILSNNHVLADENRLPVGSPIFQPGLLDQGDSTLDQIAKLARLIPLAQRATNTVDCAIAEVLDRDSVNPAVYEIGPLASDQPIPAEVEMGVQKMGRTTHRTTGSVFDTSADLLVEYRMGQLKFQNQILIRDNNGNFCRQGDSGALIIDQQTKRATALLFGASNEFTIANHLTEVLKALEVGLVS